MEAPRLLTIFISSVLSLPLFLQFALSAHIETITPNQSLTDDGKNTTLISPSQTFELGFFSPGDSKNRYIGIWYKRKPQTVVWVANRNNPLIDSNGELTIRDGSLVLLNRSRRVVWPPNILSNATSGMKLGWDLKTGFERYLTSWKSVDDPSTNDVTYRMSNIDGLSQTVLAVGFTRKYRSGIWNGIRFGGIKGEFQSVFKILTVFDEEEAYLMPETTVDSAVSIIQLNHSGFVRHLVLQDNSSEWTAMYTMPDDEQCNKYSYCGPNAICTSTGYPVLCECLQGFTPRSQEEWTGLTWSKGCERKIPLDCRKGEGFVKVAGVKLPDLLEFSSNKNMSLKECKEACLKNCSCKAYANSDVRNGGSGCLMWFNDLVDTRDRHVKGSDQDLYIRLSASDMNSIQDANNRKKLYIVLSTSLTSSTCIFGVVLWCITWKLRKGKSKDEDIDLPTFDLNTISAATNNFSPANMIGAGGFGPVYKGKLCTGKEVAVKRLAKNSGQGLKEFKNEVELIAKLQHRNLVALLGCCIQKKERILIYEYMPNKSLDHYIFDSKRCTTLPWEKHFDIVKGIARGLLYLHQDSKLRIVHRDLKASNVLLDNNLDPKISDFGLARIFGDDEKEEKTKRIVGTYGYMSPEYAIDGKFSLKSDVFSFGVVLLETVSGKKNRRFRHPEHHHNLLGHAWLLWNEDKALNLMDGCLKDSYVESQVLRCIQVGLLCVQRFPHDRPTMSSVVFMLENEGAILPRPKQPGFFVERSSGDLGSASTIDEDSHSENVLTVTIPNGR